MLIIFFWIFVDLNWKSNLITQSTYLASRASVRVFWKNIWPYLVVPKKVFSIFSWTFINYNRKTYIVVVNNAVTWDTQTKKFLTRNFNLKKLCYTSLKIISFSDEKISYTCLKKKQFFIKEKLLMLTKKKYFISALFKKLSYSYPSKNNKKNLQKCKKWSLKQKIFQTT